MPTYEYECTKCGKVTEVFQSMRDAPRRKLRAEDKPQCKCKAGVTRRISTGGGLIFKGSGFYITDYRNESYQKAAKADKEGAEGGKKDATPATTAEGKTDSVKSDGSPKSPAKPAKTKKSAAPD